MTIKNTLLSAQSVLTKNFEASEARLEAQLLMQHVLNVNRAWLISHENEQLTTTVINEYKNLLSRRLAGEPIAYILGYREFYGLKLKVTPATLIPRPDTETLVEAAIDKCHASKPSDILDLGTGCGAIALTIAKSRPDSQVTAIDASQAALKVAIENAQQLSINNVRFMLSNWFSALQNKKFDIIVSNPPYIEQNDPHLERGDLKFEPASALSSGTDGLNDIRVIINDSLAHLKPQGWLMLEHGYNQASSVKELMAQAGLVDIETHQDLGDNDRVTIGKNPLIVSTHWA